MKHLIGLIACCFLMVIMFLTGCSKEETTDNSDPVSVDVNYTKLSSFNFFTGKLSELVPNDGVLPYDLNTPLFSDYALKARFVYIPEGKQISYHEIEAFDFPAGAVLIKNFYFVDDFRDLNSQKNIIETRLLIKTSSGWESATYIWNDQQTEATLTIVGKTESVSWIDENGNTKSTDYTVPTKNDCKGCHSLSNELELIGPKARHLNKPFEYNDGIMNQLDKWSQLGFLTGSPGSSVAPAVPDWQEPTSGTLEERARAYLDINCAHCHNPQGPADNSALRLGYYETDPGHLGICKPPVAAGQGSGGLKYSIVPGQPDSSIMVYRMNSTKPDVAMPELGKTLIHEEAVQLISDWIASMQGDC